METELALTILISFLVSIAGVRFAMTLTARLGVVDVPVERSSHLTPTLRGGGLGVVAGIGIAAAIGLIMHECIPRWPVWVGLALMAGVGLFDDFTGGLHVVPRLLGQLGAALLVVIFSGRLGRVPLPAPLNVSLGAFGWALSVLWIVAFINFFNFMDGIDGLAGLQALVAGAVMLFTPNGTMAWVGAAIVGASSAFLLFNWHPAKIFLGDIGSYSLGYLIAIAPFLQDGRGVETGFLLVALAVSLFLADASFTLIRRLGSRERVWQAHRSHLYQRLVQSGFAHAQVTGLLGIGALLISTVALVAYAERSNLLWYAAIAAAMLCFALEILFTSARQRMENARGEGVHSRRIPKT